MVYIIIIHIGELYIIYCIYICIYIYIESDIQSLESCIVEKRNTRSSSGMVSRTALASSSAVLSASFKASVVPSWVLKGTVSYIIYYIRYNMHLGKYDKTM